jgi:hypothetical protein
MQLSHLRHVAALKEIFLSVFAVTLVFSACIFPRTKSRHLQQTVVWQIQDTNSVAGIKPLVLGTPKTVVDDAITALLLNGSNDGLIIPLNPLQGKRSFTIEILFNPSIDSAAPRMIHIQDAEGNRCTIELRVSTKGQWYLDAFLKNGKTNKGLTLIDSSKLHPCGQWYWAALVFDGTKMTSYVNGTKEGEGPVEFVPMIDGQTSLGVRLNRVNWFKGMIAEVRFHPEAVQPQFLQRQ